MSAKITEKKVLNITAILNVDTGKNQTVLEIEDARSPINFADLMSEFNGKEVKITVAQSEDIV